MLFPVIYFNIFGILIQYIFEKTLKTIIVKLIFKGIILKNISKHKPKC